jgi:hypothetical protein
MQYTLSWNTSNGKLFPLYFTSHAPYLTESANQYSQATRKYYLKNISLDLRETLLRFSEEDRLLQGGLEAKKGRLITAVLVPSRILTQTELLQSNISYKRL